MLPLTENTNPTTATKDGSGEQPADNAGKTGKPRGQREPKQRGPPEDGIESKTKVMVANLPYDYSEEKVRLQTIPLPPKNLGQRSHWRLNCSAQGALCGLRAGRGQDRPATDPSLHGQKASSP